MVKLFRSGRTRRGVAVVYVAISMLVILGIGTLAVDVSMLYSAQNELQRSADAAALAGAEGLLNERRLQGGDAADSAIEDALQSAAQVGALNSVLRTATVLVGDDVQAGYLPGGVYNDLGLSQDDPETWNAVSAVVQRNPSRGGSIGMFFARMFGLSNRDLRASAVASFNDSVGGFRVTERSGNAGLLPFALHVSVWNSLMSGISPNGDWYAYDPDSGEVTGGSDGVLELNLYPGAGTGQLPPGNFGTVDIGSSNNSAADIARQILEGVNADDLAYLGGSLELGDDGTLTLNGDTGLSAGFKDELDAIKGQPRTLPLFSEVSGPGNNAMYTIVGFAGVRIVNVKLTGAMKSKEVIIQPALAVDHAALPGEPGQSSYVYQPVQLVR